MSPGGYSRLYILTKLYNDILRYAHDNKAY
jgi:hypothetical protein